MDKENPGITDRITQGISNLFYGKNGNRSTEDEDEGESSSVGSEEEGESSSVGSEEEEEGENSPSSEEGENNSKFEEYYESFGEDDSSSEEEEEEGEEYVESENATKSTRKASSLNLSKNRYSSSNKYNKSIFSNNENGSKTEYYKKTPFREYQSKLKGKELFIPEKEFSRRKKNSYDFLILQKSEERKRKSYRGYNPKNLAKSEPIKSISDPSSIRKKARNYDEFSDSSRFPYGFKSDEVIFLHYFIEEGKKLEEQRKENLRKYRKLAEARNIIKQDFLKKEYHREAVNWTNKIEMTSYVNTIHILEKKRLQNLCSLISEYSKRMKESRIKKKIRTGIQFLALRKGENLEYLREKKKPMINDIESLLIHFDPVRMKIVKNSPKEFRKYRNQEPQKSKTNRLLGSLIRNLCFYAKEYYDERNKSKNLKFLKLKFFGKYNFRGEREGQGIEFFSDGKTVKFEGIFKRNVRDGRGTEFDKYGSRIFQGMFSKGKRHGRGITYGYNSNKRGIWVNGIIETGGDDGKIVNLEVVDLGKLCRKCILTDRIGKGGFGEVFKIRWNGGEYAAKILDCNPLDKLYIEKMENCVKLMNSLEHKNIITIYGWSPKGSKIGYITELCKESVYEYIQRKKNRISLKKRLDFLYYTAKGLLYLHQMQIMHRDMKWENILIAFDGSLKIIDFEFAKIDESQFRRSFLNNEKLGTNWYVAPEVYKENTNYTKKCDIYGYAIMIHILLFTENFVNPYKYDGRVYNIRCKVCGEKGITLNDLGRHIVLHSLRPKVSKAKVKGFPKELIQLMLMCWHPNPNNRPDIQFVFENIKLIREKYQQ